MIVEEGIEESLRKSLEHDVNKKINFGLIGCSSISSKHIEAINNLKEYCQLVDICDINQEALNRAIETTNARGYLDLNQMLNKSDADCMIVTTPSGLHAEHSIVSAKAGFNVLTEKPMAINLFDAKKMIKEFRRLNKKLFVVKQLRFLKPFMLLKKAIEEQRFGKIYFGNFNVLWTRPQSYYDEAPWRGTYKMDGGGAFINQAIHFIDLISWFMGPIQSLYAFTATQDRNIEAEDSGVVSLKCKSGALVTLNVNMLCYPQNFDTSVTIIGKKGTVKIGGKDLSKVETWIFEDQKDYDKDALANLESNRGHEPLYEDVIRSLSLDIDPMVTGEEGIKSLEIISAIYNSSKSNLPITLSKN